MCQIKRHCARYTFKMFANHNNMETVKGVTYFDKLGVIKQYPYVNSNLACDILIVGGGIQGAILNYYLSKTFDVVLVDATRFGKGSTAIATALLEFQLDDFAEDLRNNLSEEEIVAVYKMGLNSIEDIEKFIKLHGNHCNFCKKSAFLYSNEQKDIQKIKDEFIFRQQHGFDCKYYDEKNNPFSFDIKAGIFDKNGGAELNPYLFCMQMIENSDNQKSLYENTKIVKIEKNKSVFTCFTQFGHIITANRVIIATGFDTTFIDNDAKKLLTMQVSYSIVTNKLQNIHIYDRALVQDCLDNYHYMRHLPDGRIIFGGEDTPLIDKIDEKIAKQKYASLCKNIQKLFKNCEKIRAEYQFCGLFAQTDNNLGLIGESKIKNMYYFLSCGANGIINAIYGVKIIKDCILGKYNPLFKLFSPKRIRVTQTKYLNRRDFML